MPPHPYASGPTSPSPSPEGPAHDPLLPQPRPPHGHGTRRRPHRPPAPRRRPSPAQPDLGRRRYHHRHRQCASHQVGVDWSCPPAADLTGPALHHLPPPAAPNHAKAPDPHDTWRQRHRYGLCYFRRGPGCVSVKDSRAPDATAHFTLDDPGLRTGFLHALTPRPAHHLTPRQREAARLLVHENLLWQSPGGHLVTLPTRMLRWPIPATAA
ncbi:MULTISPECIES: DUF5825 family protein [Streptomyces]|uniref:DUF5825 family protein n=1 Tax=Streptomyces TaxID=1883 RepID=UPI001E384035|nr:MULTISPECIES: DUF5825 family protein [Streptomyces]UFQ20003.1 DUF5825 family protein [Streptomyces huasconensis]WCL89625.1 DUF5825 family protein [Streptomyces sp. JCM 35825]